MYCRIPQAHRSGPGLGARQVESKEQEVLGAVSDFSETITMPIYPVPPQPGRVGMTWYDLCFDLSWNEMEQMEL